MKPVTFYGTIPDMECLSGDTLPTFRVDVEGADVSGCTMQFILARNSDPTTAILRKACNKVDNGFEVTLTSEDTAGLAEGIYQMHFRLLGADFLDRRKLYGLLYVKTAAI